MAMRLPFTDKPDKDDVSVATAEGIDEPEPAKSALRPVDHGSHAWLFLCASFLMEGLALGFPGAYGVFQSYYSTHEPFAGASGLPVVESCAMGIMYLGMPITMGVQRLHPRLTLWAPLAGIVVMSVSLVAASFSATVPHLIATQGVVFSVGSSLSYCPCVAYLDEWFDKRKGVAYGVMWAGTGLSGSVLPFLLEYMLDEFGFRTTLRICAVGLVAITVPLVYFIKPRVPPPVPKSASQKWSGAGTRRNPFHLRFALSRTFVLHQLANVVQALGFFLPSIYLPTYASTVLGAGGPPAAATILLLNLASTVGCPVMGWLSDRLHVTTCLCIATVGAALSTLLLWGLATSLPLLLVFCGCYGLFAGSYTSAWAGLMRQVTTDAAISSAYRCDAVDPVMVMSVLAAGRGVGSVLSGPLSQALTEHAPWKGEAAAAYGSGFGPLIVFTGVTAALSGIVLPWRCLGWMR
ncbi:hypothetical protein E4U42_004340 [Claviceps africana]|uniref:Uncharacterized protein n=1 Tax=Claviceps africana TaxID=83212 RepID=A0A8K0J7M0_9HYPO|nr:hypothetical protein E4U42_004340 [Claviceps africana]